jgi:hypothetical protein
MTGFSEWPDLTINQTNPPEKNRKNVIRFSICLKPTSERESIVTAGNEEQKGILKIADR